VNSLQDLANINDDLNLISEAQNGDPKSFEQLYFLYENFVFNLCLKFHYNQSCAQDAAQEIWIHTFQRLKSFEGRSKFSTWLYRVAVNYLISAKRTEQQKSLSFEGFPKRLNSFPKSPLPHDNEYDIPNSLLVDEAMVSCTTAMLLCFSPKQRIVYLLGAVFELTSNDAAEILDIKPDTFRQQLSRARKDLYSFMHSQCSLVNPDNPCRCKHKTTRFIKEGYVNPEKLVFIPDHFKKSEDKSREKLAMIMDLKEESFSILHKEREAANNPNKLGLIKNLINDVNIQKIF